MLGVSYWELDMKKKAYWFVNHIHLVGRVHCHKVYPTRDCVISHSDISLSGGTLRPRSDPCQLQTHSFNRWSRPFRRWQNKIGRYKFPSHIQCQTRPNILIRKLRKSFSHFVNFFGKNFFSLYRLFDVKFFSTYRVIGTPCFGFFFTRKLSEVDVNAKLSDSMARHSRVIPEREKGKLLEKIWKILLFCRICSMGATALTQIEGGSH